MSRSGAFGAGAGVCLVAAMAGLGASPPARAGHPMLTEDAGTQGQGRYELELGLQRLREGDARAFEFGPQLSWGIIDNLDLAVRPTWLNLDGANTLVRGVGDTALDVKWRFFDEGPWAFGLRAGLDLPTGNEDKGLGSGEVGYHGVLIATCESGSLAFSANVGMLHVGNIPLQRRDLALASLGFVWTAGERLKFTAEVATASNPDPDQGLWPTVARFGIVWTLDEHWDVDIGYQTRLNRAAPDAAILAGATMRW